MADKRSGKDRRINKRGDVAVLLHTVVLSKGLSSTGEVTRIEGITINI